MNFTPDEITVITKVLIRQLVNDESAIEQLQKALSEAREQAGAAERAEATDEASAAVGD